MWSLGIVIYLMLENTFPSVSNLYFSRLSDDTKELRDIIIKLLDHVPSIRYTID